jgi:hypothetical protein
MGRQLQVSWSDVCIWHESGCRLLLYIKRQFYAAYNSMSDGCKYADELVKLHLIKSCLC